MVLFVTSPCRAEDAAPENPEPEEKIGPNPGKVTPPAPQVHNIK
jgi:hypothetical protein